MKPLKCIENTCYEASLTLSKTYQSLPDPSAEAKGLVRVVDDSGDDYLYPMAYFKIGE